MLFVVWNMDNSYTDNEKKKEKPLLPWSHVSQSSNLLTKYSDVF